MVGKRDKEAIRDVLTIGGVASGVKKLFGGYGKPELSRGQRLARRAKYQPYTMTGEQVQNTYGTPSEFLVPGQTPYQYGDINITDKKILKSRRLREAEVQRQAAFQERQRALHDNQARANAALGDINQQITNNAGMRDWLQQQYARLGLQRGAQARQNAINRGYGSSTVARSLELGAQAQSDQEQQAVEQQYLGNQNQLLAQQGNFYRSIDDQPMDFGTVAGYGREVGNIAASQKSAADAREAQRRQQNLDLFSNIAGTATQAGMAYATGGTSLMGKAYSPFAPQAPQYGGRTNVPAQSYDYGYPSNTFSFS